MHGLQLLNCKRYLLKRIQFQKNESIKEFNKINKNDNDFSYMFTNLFIRLNII